MVRGSADLAKKNYSNFAFWGPHFAAQRITDFFNISAWIVDFVCYEGRIAEIMRDQVSDGPGRVPRVVLAVAQHDGLRVRF